MSDGAIPASIWTDCWRLLVSDSLRCFDKFHSVSRSVSLHGWSAYTPSKHTLELNIYHSAIYTADIVSIAMIEIAKRNEVPVTTPRGNETAEFAVSSIGERIKWQIYKLKMACAAV